MRHLLIRSRDFAEFPPPACHKLSQVPCDTAACANLDTVLKRPGILRMPGEE